MLENKWNFLFSKQSSFWSGVFSGKEKNKLNQKSGKNNEKWWKKWPPSTQQCLQALANFESDLRKMAYVVIFSEAGHSAFVFDVIMF